MDVTCNRCLTIYEFDASFIAPTGTTVKCTECGHLFKVQRPMPVATAEDSANWQRSWRIRQVDGTLSVVESLAEVIRLIGAGQFAPDDEISRTGQVWKRLGTIAELAPVFSASQRAQRRSESPPPPRPNTTEGSPPTAASVASDAPPRERRRSPRDLQLEGTTARARRPSPIVELHGPRRPPVSLGSIGDVVATTPAFATPLTGVPVHPRQRPRTRGVRHYVGLLSIAGALFVTGSVAAVVFAPVRQRPPSAAQVRVAQLVTHAEQALASHRPSGFELAIQEYESALALSADDAATLSALSRAHAVWSQWLRARLGPPERTDKLLASEAGELSAQARRHADEAQRYAQRAVQLSPARGSVGLAWSDALRLAGDLPGAHAALDHARSDVDAPRAEALRVAALLAIDESGGDVRAGRVLAEQAVAAEPGLLRARFLLLHCLIGASALDAARTQLRSLQQLDPTHPSLPGLAAQLEASGARPDHALPAPRTQLDRRPNAIPSASPTRL